MCGIAGILHFNGRRAEESLIRGMTDAMSHRGPDAGALFLEGEVGLGHRRLSIIDLSTAANQPFTDHSGRYVMVFNGEIYNYNEVKKRLTDYPFRTTSDTEVLIAAYARWGPDCLDHFRGMFAFAIWDRQEKEFFIARDPMGVKPFYYSIDRENFLFASEVRSLLGTELIRKKIDRTALLDYFSFQSIDWPHSPIEGILQLEAGSWMTVRNGRIDRQRRYWDVTARSANGDVNDKEKIKRHIRELMLTSIERRLVSDVPVAAFLSGGVDSSAVVGLMAEASASKVNTFNIAFNEKDYDESQYAELVAKKFNTSHTRLLLQPTIFLDELQNGLDAMDTPSGDGINTYVVSKSIRKSGMTVALSGVGGDELFAGYPFFAQYLQARSQSWLWAIPAGIRRPLSRLIPGSGSGKNGRIAQMIGADSCTIEKLYPIFRQIQSPALMRRLTRLASPDASLTAVEQELAARKVNLRSLPLLSQVSAADYLGYTQHTLLKDTDQMSMAVSLEVREPFFDQDLVEFVLAIPDPVKKPVYPKSLLVESLKPLLPDEIVFRKKQGFLFPWNVWLKGELRPFCEERINNISQRDFVDGGQLIAYWRRFLAGDKNIRWAEIWLFVVLEYWLEKNGIS